MTYLTVTNYSLGFMCGVGLASVFLLERSWLFLLLSLPVILWHGLWYCALKQVVPTRLATPFLLLVARLGEGTDGNH